MYYYYCRIVFEWCKNLLDFSFVMLNNIYRFILHELWHDMSDW